MFYVTNMAATTWGVWGVHSNLTCATNGWMGVAVTSPPDSHRYFRIRVAK